MLAKKSRKKSTSPAKSPQRGQTEVRRKENRTSEQGRRQGILVIQRSIPRLLTKVERLALVHHTALSQGEKSGNIPLLHALFHKGTQCPTLRLKAGLWAVSSTAGAVITLVIPISFDQVYLSTSWDDVFDEFRILGAQGYYQPHTVHYYGVGAPRDMIVNVDYDSVVVLASKSEAWSYDSAKIMQVHTPASLPAVRIDGGPDTNWWNTQVDQATVMAAWKFYADGCTISNAYGEAFGSFDVQFRLTA